MRYTYAIVFLLAAWPAFAQQPPPSFKQELDDLQAQGVNVVAKLRLTVDNVANQNAALQAKLNSEEESLKAKQTEVDTVSKENEDLKKETGRSSPVAAPVKSK